MATTTTGASEEGQATGAGSTTPPPRAGVAPIRTRAAKGLPIVRFYRSAVGKKWVMAITGVILMGFVLAHMIGNLKLYLSKEEINLYGEALRNMPGPLLPRAAGHPQGQDQHDATGGGSFHDLLAARNNALTTECRGRSPARRERPPLPPRRPSPG